MKALGIFGAALAGACLAAGPSLAQLPGTYAGAPTLPVDGHVFGVYVPMSANSVGGLVQLRLSFFPGVDFGVKGGLARFDRSAGNRTLLRLGTDVKFAVSAASEARPLDIAVGGALGVTNGDDYGEVTLGPTAVVSRTFRRGQPGEATPYAGIGFAFSSLNLPVSDETDFHVPLRVGGELALSQTAKLLAELEFRLGQDSGDDVGFTVGVNMPF